MWSKCAWVRKITLIASAWTPISASIRKGEVHGPFVVHPADEVDPRLIFGARILHHVDVPGRSFGHLALLRSQLTFVPNSRARLQQPESCPGKHIARRSALRRY